MPAAMGARDGRTGEVALSWRPEKHVPQAGRPAAPGRARMLESARRVWGQLCGGR